MADPRITYNSINIDLTMGREGLTKTPTHKSYDNESGSGKIETINLFGRFEYTFDAYFTQQIYYDLWAWWSWARQGKTWSFALDSTNTGNTTLDGAAAAAQKTIPLTATAAFAAGDFCLIRAIDNDDEFEIIEIDTINAGVSVDAVDNLKYTYASADTFRHLDYFPSVILPANQRKNFEPQLTGVKAITGKYYRHTFKFTEAL